MANAGTVPLDLEGSGKGGEAYVKPSKPSKLKLLRSTMWPKKKGEDFTDLTRAENASAELSNRSSAGDAASANEPPENTPLARRTRAGRMAAR